MPKKQLTYFKTMRLKSGLLQLDVAALVGTSAQRISRIERNLSLPTTPQLLALCMIYDIRARDLMGGLSEELSCELARHAKKQEKRVRLKGATVRPEQRSAYMQSICKRFDK